VHDDNNVMIQVIWEKLTWRAI